MEILAKLKDILYENTILEKEEEKVLIVQPQVDYNGEIEYTLNYNMFDKISIKFDNNILEKYIYIDRIEIKQFGIDCLNVKSKEEFLLKNELERDINGVLIDEPNVEINNNINENNVVVSFKDKADIYRVRYSDIEVCDHWNAIIVVDIIGVKNNHLKLTSSILYLLESIDRVENNEFDIAFQKIYNAIEVYIRKWKLKDFLTPRDVKLILKDEGFNFDNANRIQRFRNEMIHPEEYEFFKRNEEEANILLDAYKYLINKYGIQ